MTRIFLILALLLSFFSCKTTQTIITENNISTQSKAINDLSVTDKEIYDDSLAFYSHLWPGDNYSDHVQLDFVTVDDKSTVVDTSNAYYYSKACYVHIYPHDVVLEKYKNSMDEESWNTVVDDNAYYQSLAFESLDKNGIENIQ